MNLTRTASVLGCAAIIAGSGLAAHYALQDSTVKTEAVTVKAPPVLIVTPPQGATFDGVAPATLTLGSDNMINGITWSRWTATEAVGAGQQMVDNCVPDCADAQVSWEPVTVTLSQVSDGHFTWFTESSAGYAVMPVDTGGPVSQEIQAAQ